MPKVREDAPERIDAYIAKAADFAQPICTRLRELIHAADGKIVEDWKWGPNFHREGMVCGIGAFKKHVSLHFFKGSLMKDPKGLFRDADDAKGSRSIVFADVGEIPATAVKAYVKEAVKLNLAGAQVATKKPPLRKPADLAKALKAQAAAGKFFANPAIRRRNHFYRIRAAGWRRNRYAGSAPVCVGIALTPYVVDTVKTARG